MQQFGENETTRLLYSSFTVDTRTYPQVYIHTCAFSHTRPDILYPLRRLPILFSM